MGIGFGNNFLGMTPEQEATKSEKEQKGNIKPQSHLCIKGHSWQGLKGHLEGCKTFQVIYLESG